MKKQEVIEFHATNPGREEYATEGNRMMVQRQAQSLWLWRILWVEGNGFAGAHQALMRGSVLTSMAS